jgi:hypothetical protein
MRIKSPPPKRLAIVVFLVAPLAAWIVVKPVRVIAPQMVGVHCVSDTICVDDLSRLNEAINLRQEALAFVAGSISPISGDPKIIFCSSKDCAESFGLGARSAVTLAKFGTIIGPQAWKPYYVRHEMIHYLQGEKIGVIAALFKPKWFIEGMAYSLSNDPRMPLAQPFELYRTQFNRWFNTSGKENLWEEVRKL